MANPTIVLNNSTGSNTQASGAGPASAIYGAAAAHTNGSASTTITLTNSPDLSGVATDGTAVLWIGTASGRKWSKISGTDNVNKTVTVEDSFNIALASAKDYAIGGKRKDLDNAEILRLTQYDIKAGWTLQLEYTGSNYTMNGQCNWNVGGDSTNGWVTICGTGATRPTIEEIKDSTDLVGGWSGSFLIVKDLQFTTSASVKAMCFNIAGSGSYFRFQNLKISGGFTYGIYRNAGLPQLFERLEITGCTTGAIRMLASFHYTLGCYIHDNPGYGLQFGSEFLIAYTIVANNTGYGLQITTTSADQVIQNCTIANNGSDGIHVDTGANLNRVSLVNTILYGNGAYGMNWVDAAIKAAALAKLVDCNAYGANDTADINNFPSGPNDVTLTGDPFVDTAGGDYSLNDTAGAGAACKGAGFPQTINAIDTYVDIGAVTWTINPSAAAGNFWPIIMRMLNQ